MREQARRIAAGAARVFVQQPDRVAAAWRRLRMAQTQRKGMPANLLDSVVEPFIRELGRSLHGEPTSAWSRTRAVLRVSRARGMAALFEEFGTLRRCLLDALEALGGTAEDCALVERSVDEAADSAAALLQQCIDPRAAPPPVPFGGLVVELFERTDEVRTQGRTDDGGAAVH